MNALHYFMFSFPKTVGAELVLAGDYNTRNQLPMNDSLERGLSSRATCDSIMNE
jgi:hypothetical protein